MSTYSSQDVLELFEAAPNLNAALKHFLKREVKKGDPGEKFAKRIKVAFSSKKHGAFAEYVERKVHDEQPYFITLAKYAFNSAIESITDSVVQEHAEKFNSTYERDESGVKVLDRTTFESILAQVGQLLDEGIATHQLPNNAFTRFVLVNWIFDQDVLKEVLPVIQKAA